MRRSLLAVLAVTVLGACGERRSLPARPERGVQRARGCPADGAVLRAESVELRGTVRPPRARVRVLGREVAVEGGAFATEGALEPGANLIEVAASANDR